MIDAREPLLREHPVLLPRNRLHPAALGNSMRCVPAILCSLAADESSDSTRISDELHEVWVELAPGMPLELLDVHGRTHSATIWPISSHGIDSVSDHDDSCDYRYVFGREAIWVA